MLNLHDKRSTSSARRESGLLEKKKLKTEFASLIATTTAEGVLNNHFSCNSKEKITLILDNKVSKVPGSRDLSEDTILEILLWLPVKILARFKCVCKQWYTIIESRNFIEQHFDHGSNEERLLVRHYKRNEHRYVYALLVDDICSRFEEPAHLQMPDMISKLLGPVNGVFCLVGQSGKLALLNPATRQLKPLAKLPKMDFEPCFLVNTVLGFGLVPLSGDYKVVSVCSFWDDRVNAPGWDTKVYNLRSDSWRNLSRFRSNYGAQSSLCNTYLNGVYYWTMASMRTNVAAILAFDITTEKFHEIQVPDCLKRKIGHLTIRGDSIVLLSYELERADYCEVWVMEKEERWNIVAVVGPHQSINGPICLWKNNELLIQAKTSLLILCNICTKKVQLTQARAEKKSRVFSYKESLVSVKGKRDNCLLWNASPDTLTIAWANEDQLTRPAEDLLNRMNDLDTDNLG